MFARLAFAGVLALIPATTFPAGAVDDGAREGAPLPQALVMHGAPARPRGPDGGFAAPQITPAPVRGGRLVMGVQGAFDSLNPLTIKGMTAPTGVAALTLQPLMRRALDEPFTLYPLVARSVELAPDNTAVTFHLDPRARFSDGKPLTADDVAFTFTLLRAQGRPNYRNALGKVTGVHIAGPHVIRFELAGNRDRELPLILAMFPVLPKHATDPEAFGQGGFTPLVGSGPYTVGQVRPGESISFVRTPSWWGDALAGERAAANFDEIRYDYFRDATAMFEAFKAGLIDVRIETDPRRWASGYNIPAVRSGQIIRENAPFAAPKGMSGFVFNERRPLFGDARVREALSFAFDFEWVNRNLYSGLYRRSDSYFADSRLSAAGQPASQRERELLQPWPDAVRADIMAGKWSPASSDGSGRDRVNLQRAVDLLGAAGYALDGGVMRDSKGAPLAFEVMVTGREHERLALALSAALRRIGVRARVRVVDSVQYERRRQTFDYDMIIATWLTSPSPGNEQYFRWGSRAASQQASFNFAGAQSPAIDAMIAAMLSARSEDDYVSAVRALDRVLLSGFHVIPLHYAPHIWLARWKHVGRPDPLPLLGAVPETWWRADMPTTTARGRQSIIRPE
ncbi:extracellular solute-binding protein [Camelimonas sp. ID_303_24]